MAGNILQALQAATQYGNAVLQQQRYLNTQIAEEEIKNIQLDFNDKLNATMADLSQRGDWNNFDETIEDFYAQYRNTAEGMVSSPYASRIVGNFLDQNYQDTKWKVNAMQLQAQKNAIVQTASKTLEQLATSNVDMQYAATMGVDSLNGCLANGAMDPQAYTQNAVTFIASALATKAETTGSELIRNGASWEEVEKAAKGVLDAEYNFRIVDTNSFSVYEDTDEYGNKVNRINPTSSTVDANELVDRKKITDDTLKSLKAQYETRKKEIQSNNANALSEMRTNILLTSDVEKIPGMISNMKSKLLGMNGDKLREEDRNQYASWLAGIEKAMQSDEPTTKSGNSTVKVAAFKGLTDSMEAYVAAAFNGEYDNLNCAKEAWVYDNYETIVNERYGGDKSKYSFSNFQYDYIKEIQDFNKAVEKSGLAPAEVKTLLSNCENVAVNFVRAEGNFKNANAAKDFMAFDEERENLKAIAFDLVMECSYSDPKDVQSIVEKYKKQINALYLDTYDYGVTTGLFKPSEDTQIARDLERLQRNESAYTTGDGIGENRQVRFAPGAKEGAEKDAPLFAQKIADATGIDPSSLTWTHEKTQYDVNAVPIFSDNSGNQYKLYTSDGNTYEVQEKKAGTKEWVKVESQNTSGKQSAYKTYKVKEDEYLSLAEDLVDTGRMPPNVNDWEAWQNMSLEEKTRKWEQWVKEHPEESKRTLEAFRKK